MGMIGTVLSVTRVDINGQRADDVRAELGSGEIVTAHYFGTAGDDSPANPGDLVLLEPGQGAGVYHAVGFVDPASAQTALSGERRIYARDSSGAEVASVWLKASGEIVMTSTADITINGMTISPSGVVTIGGKVINDHVHGGVTPGGGASGPNM